MRQRQKRFFIWEGVYPSFDQVPKRGPGFNQSKLVRKFELSLKKVRKVARAHCSVPREPRYEQSVLPVIAGIVSAEFGRVRVLDFGGGIGIDFLRLCTALPEASRIQFTVIESPRVSVAGRREFAEDDRIHFQSRLPQRLRSDIVHIGSSLQYIRDWQRVLLDLVRVARPRYFLFTDLPAGDIPTFASAQIYYGSTIPYWFFNVSDILAVMRSLGFVLCSQSAYEYKHLGRYRNFPVSNLPPRYRLPYACNLLFMTRKR